MRVKCLAQEHNEVPQQGLVNVRVSNFLLKLNRKVNGRIGASKLIKSKISCDIQQAPSKTLLCILYRHSMLKGYRICTA